MLIVYSHPTKDGHSGYVLEQVKKRLEEKGVVYDVVDLYAIKWNPILSAAEYDPEKSATSGAFNANLPEDVLEMQKKIIAHDRLIFIQPIWWNGVPAILKGFFDRVLTANFAFKYEKGIPVGLLPGKKAAVFMTGGGPRLYQKFILADRAMKVVVKDVLEFCGIKAKGFQVGNAGDNVPDAMKIKLAKMVDNGMAWLLG